MLRMLREPQEISYKELGEYVDEVLLRRFFEKLRKVSQCLLSLGISSDAVRVVLAMSLGQGGGSDDGPMCGAGCGGLCHLEGCKQ